MPRRQRKSVQQILLTLASLMPSLWRAQLIKDTMLSLQLSLGCSFWTNSKLLWSVVGSGVDGPSWRP